MTPSPFQPSADAPDGPFGPHTEAPEAIKSEPTMNTPTPTEEETEVARAFEWVSAWLASDDLPATKPGRKRFCDAVRTLLSSHTAQAAVIASQAEEIIDLEREVRDGDIANAMLARERQAAIDRATSAEAQVASLKASLIEARTNVAASMAVTRVYRMALSNLFTYPASLSAQGDASSLLSEPIDDALPAEKSARSQVAALTEAAAALTTMPQPESDTARREAYARIIDPKAWKVRQEHLDRAEHWAVNPDNFRDSVAEMFRAGNLADADLVVRESLAKADAILAKESQALGEALARVESLEAFARDMADLNDGDDPVGYVVESAKAALAGARP